MSDSRSLFSKASSYKDRLLSDSNLELPRWRTPSMASSVVPPPIVQSTYASPQIAVVQSTIIHRPTPFADRQHELEADLQYLLDAQADGLAGGTGSGLPDDQASNGSTTPTALSVRSASAKPSPSRARRKPGIRSARKGIYNSILALSKLKEEEIEGIVQEIRSNEQTIEKIEGWQRKRLGLQKASKNVDSNEDTIRSQRLWHEANTLHEEISHVELQLADMKARHRKLMREVAAAENSVQAKMASYTSSLRLLEEDVQKFLTANPASSSSRPTYSDGYTSLWQLPPKRRTLDLAKQHWNEERSLVSKQRESVQHEKAALDEGSALWKEVVVQLTDFERQFRSDMAAPGVKARANSPRGKSPSAADHLVDPELLKRMDMLIADLEAKFDHATSQRWNLLIAAIGAELDALRQGRLLLGGPLPTEKQSGESEQTESAQPSPTIMFEGDKSTKQKRTSNGSAPEDDPDPELLFSKHDLDSE